MVTKSYYCHIGRCFSITHVRKNKPIEQFLLFHEYDDLDSFVVIHSLQFVFIAIDIVEIDSLLFIVKRGGMSNASILHEVSC